ncbi:hypothetical protein CC78DRAFT_154282 [Lojkania enalia]|uniref:Uncharacterized protein n=1 Tax=Lojkania enalia TaxID=147567 RepID=A0A9P4KCZ3_9PLEO|nr:hypothetical protein CC78DRAFT_154282 [Didymosphaeria enalia]
MKLFWQCQNRIAGPAFLLSFQLAFVQILKLGAGSKRVPRFSFPTTPSLTKRGLSCTYPPKPFQAPLFTTKIQLPSSV